jgi:hypothetical protein
MSKADFNETMCDECGQPLFLTVEECKAFIEKKLREGFISRIHQPSVFHSSGIGQS